MTDHAVVPADRRALLAGIGGLAAGTFLAAGRAEAGPLNPPASPASTPGPEPRIAINEANTPGSADALHVISQPGSYYMTANITGQSGKHGILIQASNVMIDMMGFALLGVPSSLRGVGITGVCDNLVVRNGIASNWGLDGVNLTTGGTANRSLIEGVVASGNGSFGITAPSHSVVRGCVVQSSGLSGISVGSHSVISECVSRNNAGRGLSTTIGTVITACSVSNNGDNGIECLDACTLSESSAVANSSSGIRTRQSCIVSACTVRENGGTGIFTEQGTKVTGCVAHSNAGIGIQVALSSTVADCLAVSNGNSGISLAGFCHARANHCDFNGRGTVKNGGIVVNGTGSRIEANSCTDNGIGLEVVGVGNLLTGNTCRASMTNNWSVAAGNKCLVVLAAVAPAFSGNAGGVALGSTDPYVNFSY
jgi:hypothetical protein